MSAIDSQGRSVLSPTIVDLAYATESKFEKMDVFLPSKKKAERIPVVIWIHGGGFTVGDKSSMPMRDYTIGPRAAGHYQIQVPDVSSMLDRGYAVVSLNYHLGISPVTAARAALKDVKAAIRFLHHNAGRYGFDEDRFVVWGNSVGGYMAAMVGVTGDQPSVMDDFALCPPGRSDVRGVIVWFGAEDRAPSNSLKIATYIPSAKKLPAFLIENGDRDPIISVAQARRLNDALSNAGAKVTLRILAGAGHEDPIFTATQMVPAFTFIDEVLRN